MKTLATILLGAVLFLPLTALATEIPGGPVYGHWYSSGNPYNVNGGINVPVDSTLYIHEGVEVIFQGQYGLTVYGFLEAVGTEVDSVHFTGNSWSSIIFQNAPDSSHMFYCTVRYCIVSGLLCRNSKPVISHCTFSHISSWFGAIYVIDGGSPSLSHCTISDSRGGHSGGGISWWSGAGGTISDCIIRNNRGLRGGGVCVVSSNVTLDNCTISDNRAEILGGGGVYCDYSSPTFINCTITNNTAEDDCGGGVACNLGGRATFINCTINGNYADDRAHPPYIGGGGISLYMVSANLSNCTIFDNFSEPGGGGIAIYYSGNLSLDHCTIESNYTIAPGSGIDIYSGCTAEVTNSIISNNYSDYGIHNSGTLTVDFTDFFNNYAGPISGNIPTGFGELTQTNANGDSCDVYYNIFLDPLFVGRYSEDYNLRWRSPCIDAGDPDSPLDPDNTVCDMGRFYFNQDVLGVVEVYPQNEPVVIPPGGGQIVYDGWVFNFTGHPGRADIWTYAFVPGVGRYGPIDLYPNFRIPPDSIGMNNIRQKVPGVAPQGDYTLVAYLGSYPSTIIDSSYFYFSKSGSVGGGVTGWFDGDEWLKVGDLAESNLPGAYALSQNYPNPFNAATTIHYQLPVDTDVKLEVYNTLGQKVATVVDERQQAGYKSVIWDASDVSSGLYFYKLTAGDFTETRRMMLVK